MYFFVDGFCPNNARGVSRTRGRAISLQPALRVYTTHPFWTRDAHSPKPVPVRVSRASSGASLRYFLRCFGPPSLGGLASNFDSRPGPSTPHYLYTKLSSLPHRTRPIHTEIVFRVGIAFEQNTAYLSRSEDQPVGLRQ